MTAKDLDKLTSWIVYGGGFLAWATFTFLYFVNMENYKEDPFNALMTAILLPPCVLTVVVCACWIMSLRFDTRVSAIGKIGTDESWDWTETFEMISMFSD